VSDIFREVEEEVRRERLERIWKEYGDYIVAIAALLILAAAGWRLWNVYQVREAARASDRFIAAQALQQSGQAHAAAQMFARLSQTAPGGYANLSQLAEADALAASNKPAALNIYRKLASSSDDVLSAVARLRAAWILVEGAPKSDIDSMIGSLAADDSPWRDVAREILAYADYRAGATEHAQSEFQRLGKDPRAPPGVRARSEAMATFLSAGGSKDFGQVPPMLPETPVIPKSAPNAPPAATGAGNRAAAASANSGATQGNASGTAPAKGEANTNPKGSSPK
jgi:hypothetical protein